MRSLVVVFLLSDLLGLAHASRVARGVWSGTWRDSRTNPPNELRTMDRGSGKVEFELELWDGADNSSGVVGLRAPAERDRADRSNVIT